MGGKTSKEKSVKNTVDILNEIVMESFMEAGNDSDSIIRLNQTITISSECDTEKLLLLSSLCIENSNNNADIMKECRKMSSCQVFEDTEIGNDSKNMIVSTSKLDNSFAQNMKSKMEAKIANKQKEIEDGLTSVLDGAIEGASNALTVALGGDSSDKTDILNSTNVRNRLTSSINLEFINKIKQEIVSKQAITITATKGSQTFSGASIKNNSLSELVARAYQSNEVVNALENAIEMEADQSLDKETKGVLDSFFDMLTNNLLIVAIVAAVSVCLVSVLIAFIWKSGGNDIASSMANNYGSRMRKNNRMSNNSRSNR